MRWRVTNARKRMSIWQRISIPVLATGLIIPIGLMEKQTLRSLLRVTTRASCVDRRCKLRSATNSSLEPGLWASCSQVSVLVLDFVDQLITGLSYNFITFIHWVSMVSEVVVSREFFLCKVLAFQNTRPFVTIFRCKLNKMLFPKSFNLAFKHILACMYQTLIFFSCKYLL